MLFRRWRHSKRIGEMEREIKRERERERGGGRLRGISKKRES